MSFPPRFAPCLSPPGVKGFKEAWPELLTISADKQVTLSRFIPPDTNVAIIPGLSVQTITKPGFTAFVKWVIPESTEAGGIKLCPKGKYNHVIRC